MNPEDVKLILANQITIMRVLMHSSRDYNYKREELLYQIGSTTARIAKIEIEQYKEINPDAI